MAYKDIEKRRAHGRAAQKRWRVKHGKNRDRPRTPAENRNQNLRRMYGITSKEFESILDAQGGTCAVCSGPPLGKGNRYHVDHCHKSKKIRGLLCHKCNVTLGMVGDNPDHLSKLIEYLLIHS